MSSASRVSTAERINDTALSLFASNGYEGTSLSHLAQAVGIRKPSLYNHIDSKEALFMSLVDQVEQTFFRELDASVAEYASAGTEMRVFALVLGLSRFILEADQGAFYKRYLLFPPAQVAMQVRAVTERSEQRIDEVLGVLYRQGATEGCWNALAAREFFDAFYVLVDGLFSQCFIYSNGEYDRRLRSIWPVFWAGLQRR